MPRVRAINLTLALYLACVLGVAVPSHPLWHGAHEGHASADATHADHDAAHGDHDAAHADHDPAEGHGPGDDGPGHRHGASCSICLFASRLGAADHPPAPVPRHEVACVREASAPAPILCSSFVPTLFGRAPPTPAR